MTRLGFTLAGLVLLAGCVGTVMTADGRRISIRSVEFEGYVERVFREQSQIATALAFAQEVATGARYERLLEAEDALLEACAALNELASARRDGRSLGLRDQRRMALTTPNCESATQNARPPLAAP